MCKKTIDNEDVETSNNGNQRFSLDANFNLDSVFKLIEDKIKSLSPSEGWDLYLSTRENSVKTDNEAKDENKKLKVMDSDIFKSMEKDDKYTILERYFDVQQELLSLKRVNKNLNDELQRKNENYQQIQENLRRCEKERIELLNSNGGFAEIIKEKKATINNLNIEIIALKKALEKINNKSNFEDIQFQRKKNNELDSILFKKESDLERNKLRKFNNDDFIKKENFDYHQNYDYSNNNYNNNNNNSNNNNSMMDNDSKFYPNQMSNSVDAPKQQDGLANLFMLAEQTLRMENDYPNNDIRMDPMKDGNQPILPRDKHDIKNEILMGRRSSINSMAVFTPPTSPITHSNNNNNMIPNGSMNLPSKMNNYNSNGMNNSNFNNNGRNMNSNGNTSGNRPRGRPSHKETNNNDNTKRHKLIAVNPNMPSSQLFNVSRMINNNNNNNNPSQNYMYDNNNNSNNNNNRSNVLPALNHSHTQENVELPSIPMEIQRNNGMDNYKPMYNGNKDINMNENQEYPLSSNENDGDRNELSRNNNNDNISMNNVPLHKRKNSFSYQQQSSYTSGKVGTRKNSQSGSVPIQPQQNKKQKYYQQLQPQTNSKNSNGTGKNGSNSPSTPISSPSSSSSSNSHHTSKETKHVSPSAYVRWRTNEDDLLRSLVKKMGPKQWDKIAEEIPGRTYHQCRQRWVNTLSKKFPEDRAAIRNRNSNSVQHHNSSPVLLAPSTSRYNNPSKHSSLDESELSYNNKNNLDRDMDYPSKKHSLNAIHPKDKVMNGPSNDYSSNNDYYSKNMNMNQEYNNNNSNGNNNSDSLPYQNDFRLNPIQNNKKNLNNNSNNIDLQLPKVDELNPRHPLTNSPSLAPINPHNKFESKELPSFNSLTNEKNTHINNNNLNSSYLNPINTNTNHDSNINNNTNNINSSTNINYSKNININNINDNRNNNNNNDKRNNNKTYVKRGSSLNDLLINQDDSYNSISTSNSNLNKNDTPVVMDEITTTISSGTTSNTNYYNYTSDSKSKNNGEHMSGSKNTKTNTMEDSEIEEIMVEGAISARHTGDENEKNRKLLNNITQSPKSQKSEEEEEDMDTIENFNSKSMINGKDGKNKMDNYNLRGMKRKRGYPINNTLNKKIHSTIEQNNIDMPLTPQSISEGAGSISMNDGVYVKKNDTSSSALASPSPSSTESSSDNGKQLNKGAENTTNMRPKGVSVELDNGREKSEMVIEGEKSTVNAMKKASGIALE